MSCQPGIMQKTSTRAHLPTAYGIDREKCHGGRNRSETEVRGIHIPALLEPKFLQPRLPSAQNSSAVAVAVLRGCAAFRCAIDGSPQER